MSSSAYQIHIGDCLEALRAMPDNSVDSIVTDPPYGLSKEPDMAEVLRHWLAGDDYQHKGGGFMGKTWDSFVPGPAVWREALRVLKPGGHLLAFFGTRTQDMGTLAIRLAGFEIRDSIAWVYGSGFPKSHNLEGDWEGWGTALKPALEPITVARKPFKGTVAANVLAHSTGALNIDACRVAPTGERLGGGDESGKASKPEGWARPWMDDHDHVAAHNAKITANVEKASELGRWPANLIHDGSDEVLAAFPQAPGQLGDLKGHAKDRQSPNGCFGKMAPAKDHAARVETDTSAARFFKQCEVTDAEWLENLSPALIVGSSLSLQSLADAIAQSDAAISALPEGTQLSASMAASTNATQKESRQIATAVITAMPSIVSACLLGPQQERLTLSLNHVSVVAQRMPTGITTITASLSSSGGSAVNITFNIMPKSLVAGAKGCEQSSARFMYCAKASRKDRNEGVGGSDSPAVGTGATMREREDADWSERNGNHHPTVKPTDLMAYLCRLVTPPGGTVLDPFMGSGSTGKAAMREGFRFIGCELSEEYATIARARIEHALTAAMQEPANENEAPIQIDMGEVWGDAQ